MRPVVLVLTAFIVGVVGVLLGLWWTPFLAGAAIGIAVSRPVLAIPAGGVTGLVSWLLPLLGIEMRYGLMPAAVSLSAVMGFGHQGSLPVALTLLVGTLLGLCGAWLTCAVRMLVLPAPR